MNWSKCVLQSMAPLKFDNSTSNYCFMVIDKLFEVKTKTWLCSPSGPWPLHAPLLSFNLLHHGTRCFTFLPLPGNFHYIIEMCSIDKLPVRSKITINTTFHLLAIVQRELIPKPRKLPFSFTSPFSKCCQVFAVLRFRVTSIHLTIALPNLSGGSWVWEQRWVW